MLSGYGEWLHYLRGVIIMCGLHTCTLFSGLKISKEDILRISVYENRPYFKVRQLFLVLIYAVFDINMYRKSLVAAFSFLANNMIPSSLDKSCFSSEI